MKDTIAKASDGKGMQEDVTPDSHGFTQKKTEVGASVHSHQSVAGVYRHRGWHRSHLERFLGSFSIRSDPMITEPCTRTIITSLQWRSFSEALEFKPLSGPRFGVPNLD